MSDLIDHLESLAHKSRSEHNTIIMPPTEALKIVAAVRAAQARARRWKAAAKKQRGKAREWYTNYNIAFDRVCQVDRQRLEGVIELAALKAEAKQLVVALEDAVDVAAYWQAIAKKEELIPLDEALKEIEGSE